MCQFSLRLRRRPTQPPHYQSQLETATTNHAAGFAAIWSMLVLFAILVGGTITMKRVRALLRSRLVGWMDDCAVCVGSTQSQDQTRAAHVKMG